MRLLTLICFFHFSGINNGFTHMVSVAGNVQAMNLTATIARNIAPTINSTNWKPFLSKNKWSQLFSRSNQIVQSSCKNIVQNALLKVDFSEIGSEQDLKKKLSQTQISSQNQETSLISSLIGQLAQTLLSIPSIESNHKVNEVPEHLYNMERWLKISRTNDLWDWNKYKKKDFPPGSTQWSDFSLEDQYALGQFNSKSEFFTDTHRGKFSQWIIRNISGRNDTSDNHLNKTADRYTRHALVTGNFFALIKIIGGDIK